MTTVKSFISFNQSMIWTIDDDEKMNEEHNVVKVMASRMVSIYE
jgi:hypothetical protein